MKQIEKLVKDIESQGIDSDKELLGRIKKSIKEGRLNKLEKEQLREIKQLLQEIKSEKIDSEKWYEDKEWYKKINDLYQEIIFFTPDCIFCCSLSFILLHFLSAVQ